MIVGLRSTVVELGESVGATEADCLPEQRMVRAVRPLSGVRRTELVGQRLLPTDEHAGCGRCITDLGHEHPAETGLDDLLPELLEEDAWLNRHTQPSPS